MAIDKKRYHKGEKTVNGEGFSTFIAKPAVFRGWPQKPEAPAAQQVAQRLAIKAPAAQQAAKRLAKRPRPSKSRSDLR
jgi:hypothetical protein